MDSQRVLELEQLTLHLLTGCSETAATSTTVGINPRTS